MCAQGDERRVLVEENGRTGEGEKVSEKERESESESERKRTERVEISDGRKTERDWTMRCGFGGRKKNGGTVRLATSARVCDSMDV